MIEGRPMITVQNEFQPGTAAMTCYICKSDLRKESPTGQEPHEVAIDTGVSIDFEGFLAFCESCVVEMASLLGMKTPQQVADIEADRDLAIANAVETARVLDLTETALNSLRALPEPKEADVINIDEPVKRGPGRPRKNG